ncbi:hypothetical protein EGW08_012619 [Elysia chlorotica]|uniref:Uncharacterized protein n=1 Tax=Elysia chlorotica TaxID=188477 RepID=A0A3S1A0K0_ELYCH|nr:hypothetical protein EGW08_012619 [Elysia chlorotica]
MHNFKKIRAVVYPVEVSKNLHHSIMTPVSAACLCVLLSVCLSVRAQVPGGAAILQDMQTHMEDIYEWVEGLDRPFPADIQVTADKLRLRVQSAIQNLSEVRLKDAEKVLRNKLTDIESSLDLTQFFHYVQRAIDSTSDFKNTFNY